MLHPQGRAPLSGAGPPSPSGHNPGVGGAGEDFSAAEFGAGYETAAAAHAAQAAEESAPAAAQAEKGRRERGGQFPGNVPTIDPNPHLFCHNQEYREKVSSTPSDPELH